MDRRQRILVLGLAAVLIIGVIATAFSLGNRSAPKPSASQIVLTDHTTDGSEVRLTIEGPVNADELHRSTVISVSRDGRAIEFDKTYSDSPVASATYLNNQTAFDDFMQALQNAGFTKQTKNATQQDETGQCPLGQRYIYELVTNDAVAMRTWSSSCQGVKESFGGSATLVQQLFRAQIPDYAKVQATALK